MARLWARAVSTSPTDDVNGRQGPRGSSSSPPAATSAS
jgi:hypothetical protein